MPTANRYAVWGFQIICGVAHAQAGADCSALLKNGLYDTSSSSSKVAQIETAIQHLCMSRAGSSSEASAIGASVGIPDLPVVLGFDQSGKSFSEWKETLCSDYFSKSQKYGQMDQAVSKVTDQAPAIIAACKGKTGMLAYTVKEFPPSADFLIQLDYTAGLNGKPSTTVSVVSPGDKVSCVPTKVSSGTQQAMPCSLNPGATSALLALRTNPTVDTVVSSLNYNTALPQLPTRQVDIRPQVESQVTVTVTLNTGGPGPTKITLDGRFRMNGTKPGPYSILTVKLDGKDLGDECKPRISGVDNAQEGPFHCEINRYLVDGSATITASQNAFNGDPSWVRLNAKAEPLLVQTAVPRLRSFVEDGVASNRALCPGMPRTTKACE